MKNNNLVLAILGGVAVGTVLGILFAPAKGSEIRKTIAKKGADYKDTLKDSTSKLSNKISQTRRELKNEYQQFMENPKDFLNEEKVNLENLKDINKSIILR